MTALDNVRGAVEVLRYCKAKKAELTERENDAKAAIQEALGNDDSGTIDGVEVVTWKTHKRRALDQKALRAKLPEVFDLYSTTTEVRRFEVLDD